MKNRPEDEEMTLHLFGDAADPAAVDARLAADPAARAEFERLRRTLEATSGLEAPDPGADFERRLWGRIAPRLDRRRPRALFGLAAPWGWLASAAAAALVLALGFALGRRSVSQPAEETIAGGAATQAIGERSVEDGETARERLVSLRVGEHLAGSERLLTSLANSPDSSGDALAAERAWAEALLASNRLYRRAAERAGQTRVVLLLEELEPILTELAHASDSTSSTELADLRQRIQTRDLLFKVRVVGERLEREPAVAHTARIPRSSS